MRRYTYTRWGGAERTVTAYGVTFEPSGHVAFWDAQGRLVVAERSEQVNELREVTSHDGCGDSTCDEPHP